MEDYIFGEEYSLEGYVNKKDGIQSLYKTIKFKTKIPFFEELAQYADINIKWNNGERKIFKGCVCALEVKNSVIHFEVINNGYELIPVEIAARLTGDKIPY